MSYSLGTAALTYAARGWLVLPVHTPLQEGCSCGGNCGASVGKHPRTRHGLKEATRHLDQIWRWWRQWPAANIGICTGRASGLVVLDVDSRHDGEASLAVLEATYDRLPATLTVHTGGGGRHLYFQHPGTGRIPNCTRLGGYPGLDVRGDGGYVVAPPSLHHSGQAYTWGDPSHQLALLPAWVSSVLLAAPAVRGSSPFRWLEETPQEAETVLLQQALRQARPGTRNVTGYWLACRLRETGVSLAAARAIMLRYAAQVEAGDHPYEVREALASLRSAYQRASGVPARKSMRPRGSNGPTSR